MSDYSRRCRDGITVPRGWPVKSDCYERPSRTKTYRIGSKVGEGLTQRAHLAARGALHVVELVFEFRKLPGHRPDLGDLVRDLRDRVHDDRGPLEPTPEVEVRARPRGARSVTRWQSAEYSGAETMVSTGPGNSPDNRRKHDRASRIGRSGCLERRLQRPKETWLLADSLIATSSGPGRRICGPRSRWLSSGDRIFIDVSRRVPVLPGILVIWDGMGLVAKRIEHVPHAEPPKVVLKSLNPEYDGYERSVAEVRVVGRGGRVPRRLLALPMCSGTRTTDVSRPRGGISRCKLVQLE